MAARLRWRLLGLNGLYRAHCRAHRYDEARAVLREADEVLAQLAAIHPSSPFVGPTPAVGTA
jgi:pentatricopeptide repeat protein